MTKLQNNGVTFLAADSFLAAGGVAHGFSTRVGGVSGGIYASMNLGSTRGDDPAGAEPCLPGDRINLHVVGVVIVAGAVGVIIVSNALLIRLASPRIE